MRGYHRHSSPLRDFMVTEADRPNPERNLRRRELLSRKSYEKLSGDQESAGRKSGGGRDLDRGSSARRIPTFGRA